MVVEEWWRSGGVDFGSKLNEKTELGGCEHRLSPKTAVWNNKIVIPLLIAYWF